MRAPRRSTSGLLDPRPAPLTRVAGRTLFTAGLIGVVAMLVMELAAAFVSPGGPEVLGERHWLGFVWPVLVLGSWALALLALTRRPLLSTVLVLGVAASLASFHVRKMQLLGLPLLPWDLAHARHVLALLPTFAFDGVSIGILAALALLVGLVVRAALHGPERDLAGPLRWVLLVLAVAASWGIPKVTGHPRVRLSFDQGFGLVPAVGNLAATVDRAGLGLTLLWNLDALHVDRPRDYSNDAVQRALASAMTPATGHDRTASVDGTKPDLVLVLAESLFDPSKLGLAIGPDPLEFLHSLEATFPHGDLVSPVFGGATANAEFEVLAGLPVAFMPEGALAYTHYVQEPVRTVASRLRDAGWKTRALHTFHRWFWARESVYPLLGIDTYDGLEAFPAKQRFGPWVSDEELTDGILQGLDVPGDAPPLFQFAISMGTHGTYLYAHPEPANFKLEPGLSQWVEHEVLNYIEAVGAFDLSMKRLVSELSKRSRPTALVVFGDHLPILGPDYAAYRERHLVDAGWSPQQREWIATVPAWTWWNAAAAPALGARMSGAKLSGGLTSLSPWLARLAGLPAEPYDHFVEAMSKRLPVLRRNLVRDGSGHTWDAPAQVDDAESKAAVEAWRLLAFDRLHGSRFSVKPAP